MQQDEFLNWFFGFVREGFEMEKNSTISSGKVSYDLILQYRISQLDQTDFWEEHESLFQLPNSVSTSFNRTSFVSNPSQHPQY